MLKTCYLGILMLIIVGLACVADAQEPPPPYTDDTYITYYDDERPEALNDLLIFRNICLETFMRLNPIVDIHYISYGTQIRLPKDEACYDYSNVSHRNVYNSFSDSSGDVPLRLKFYEGGRWLDEPYYSADVLYIGRNRQFASYPHFPTLQEIADMYGVCVEDLLAENYLLHDYEGYKNFNAPSIDVFIPRYLRPCYPENSPIGQNDSDYITIEINSKTLTPLLFSEGYNVCVEEVMTPFVSNNFYALAKIDELIKIRIPKNALPCYNTQGQRLRYYDDANRRLETPVYSDLPVYITEPNQTLQQVATILGVCEVDLFRVNQFPDLPINSRIELFIPPSRSCPDNLALIEVNRKNIMTVSVITNMCPNELMTLNPHLINDTATHPIYSHDEFNASHWVIIDAEKVQHEPCYIRYNAQDGESVFDIERELNVCFEEFILYENLDPQPFLRIIISNDVTIFIPSQALPCYNELGQRLYYPDGLYPSRYPSNNIIIQRPLPSYSDKVFYQSQSTDTVYDISKKFNVCVRDLLRVNPLIRQRLPQGIPILIPDMRPCYDEATGKQLIYEDNFGNPLPEPILSDYLIHYGEPIESHLAYYYNVCLNRIRAATRSAEIDRLDHYAGYIIPTDRPPCYNPDNDWQPIEYICYQHPIGQDTIAQTDIEMTFDAEGAYCYDIQNPQTVIWYENQPYKLFWKADETLQLNSRAIQRGVLAWCFGVSLDEVNNISRNIGFQPIQPSYFYGWIIPMPTRECYLENSSILDGKITHTVEYGETLISIAQEYDVPYPMISVANQLWLGNVIWEGQILMIPSPAQTGDLWWLIPLWLFWGWWCVHIGRMVITEICEKRGWK